MGESAVYLYGSMEDYDRWSHLVGDETWNWEHTKEIFKDASSPQQPDLGLIANVPNNRLRIITVLHVEDIRSTQILCQMSTGRKGSSPPILGHSKAHVNRSVDISLPTHLEKGVDLFLDAGFDFGVSHSAFIH